MVCPGAHSNLGHASRVQEEGRRIILFLLEGRSKNHGNVVWFGAPNGPKTLPASLDGGRLFWARETCRTLPRQQAGMQRKRCWLDCVGHMVLTVSWEL